MQSIDLSLLAFASQPPVLPFQVQPKLDTRYGISPHTDLAFRFCLVSILIPRPRHIFSSTSKRKEHPICPTPLICASSFSSFRLHRSTSLPSDLLFFSGHQCTILMLKAGSRGKNFQSWSNGVGLDLSKSTHRIVFENMNDFHSKEIQKKNCSLTLQFVPLYPE